MKKLSFTLIHTIILYLLSICVEYVKLFLSIYSNNYVLVIKSIYNFGGTQIRTEVVELEVLNNYRLYDAPTHI